MSDPRTKDTVIAAAINGDGCLGRSQPDEPVFTLCARDRYAASTVRKWAETIAYFHGASAKTDDAYRLADEMDAWREANGLGAGKVPD